MSVRVARGYETEYPSAIRGYFSFKPAALFEKRRLPYKSISYGPLLFALPIPDRDPDTPEAGTRWQFALDNASQSEGRDITPQRKAMPKTWNWPLDAPLALKVPARAFDWKPTERPGPARGPVTGESFGDDSPGALWLYEVSHLHVSRDGQGMERKAR